VHRFDVFGSQVFTAEVGMSIIQAFLSRALNIAPHQVAAWIHRKMLVCPVVASLDDKSDAFCVLNRL